MWHKMLTPKMYFFFEGVFPFLRGGGAAIFEWDDGVKYFPQILPAGVGAIF